MDGIYANEWYNGKKATKEEYINNTNSILLGMPRLRQLRVKKGRKFSRSLLIFLTHTHFKISRSEKSVYHNPRTRAVRISAIRAGKSRTALLGTRTVPCDAISGDFVAFKHPSYLQPEKQIQKT